MSANASSADESSLSVPDDEVIRWTRAPSPLGDLRVTGDGTSVTGIYFPQHLRQPAAVAGERNDDDPVLMNAVRQLTEYFAKDRQEFDLPLAAAGSQFQRRVWTELRRIGYGETRSYAEVAAALGLRVGAARAVGLANGANPISIVVPCHRVIGADGSLTGYGGGLERKRFLLDLETAGLF